MSCYHPLYGFPDGKTENGKTRYRFVSGCDYVEAKEFDPNVILVPCGRCLGCRLDYSRSWADRMMLELETSGDALFLTLTYNNSHAVPAMVSDYYPADNEYFPQDGLVRLNGDKAYLCESFTLYKRDVQLFMKRLRKKFSDKRIRFYLAGEYGDSTFRPHYHLICFGIGLADLSDLHSHGVNELGQAYYISDTLTRVWHNGFVLLSAVSWQTCAYVARYVTKKLGSHVLTRDYLNQLPEFALMSRKPGLGKEYLDLHPDCLEYDNINLSTPQGGLKIKLPKYYLKQLQREGTDDFPNPLYNPDKYDSIMKERSSMASDSMLLQLEKTNLRSVEYLEAKENRKFESLKGLKRFSEMSHNL